MAKPNVENGGVEREGARHGRVGLYGLEFQISPPELKSTPILFLARLSFLAFFGGRAQRLLAQKREREIRSPSPQPAASALLHSCPVRLVLFVVEAPPEWMRMKTLGAFLLFLLEEMASHFLSGSRGYKPLACCPSRGLASKIN